GLFHHQDGLGRQDVALPPAGPFDPRLQVVIGNDGNCLLKITHGAELSVAAAAAIRRPGVFPQGVEQNTFLGPARVAPGWPVAEKGGGVGRHPEAVSQKALDHAEPAVSNRTCRATVWASRRVLSRENSVTQTSSSPRPQPGLRSRKKRTCGLFRLWAG